MKSKEAIKIITDSITEGCRPCSCSDCIENSNPCLEYRTFKQIEKDLEILEILKQYITYEDYNNGIVLYDLNKIIHRADASFGDGWEKELEEFNKIKEWLENE